MGCLGDCQLPGCTQETLGRDSEVLLGGLMGFGSAPWSSASSAAWLFLEMPILLAINKRRSGPR